MRIELTDGRSLQRENVTCRWSLFGINELLIRLLDEFEDEMVTAAFIAGRIST